ncbi:MAG TPA: hypothetical protein VEF55_05540 [Candidatus Binatia bacterium]|nr:hypothetical protein [Candidatus Binatia bacterium]
MMWRLLFGAACACALAACNEPTETNEQPEGSYGSSSGPNANDPDATTAGQDQNPTYDEAETAAGSEFGEPTDPARADDQSQQSNPN